MEGLIQLRPGEEVEARRTRDDEMPLRALRMAAPEPMCSSGVEPQRLEVHLTRRLPGGSLERLPGVGVECTENRDGGMPRFLTGQPGSPLMKRAIAGKERWDSSPRVCAIRSSSCQLFTMPPLASSAQRLLRPEILDSLPPSHPDAIRSRRDLRLTNRLLGSHKWVERILPGLLRTGEVVLEVGAGAGELGRRLTRRGVEVAGLDLTPRPDDWPEGLRWHQEEAKQFAGYSAYRAVVGNLFFHHFSDADLAILGERIRPSVRVMVACEPRRRRLSQILFRALGPLFGVNHVTLHDAHVSIGAGFRRRELPQALGLHPSAWEIHCSVSVLGLYRMTAVRRS